MLAGHRQDAPRDDHQGVRSLLAAERDILFPRHEVRDAVRPIAPEQRGISLREVVHQLKQELAARLVVLGQRIDDYFSYVARSQIDAISNTYATVLCGFGKSPFSRITRAFSSRYHWYSLSISIQWLTCMGWCAIVCEGARQKARAFGEHLFHLVVRVPYCLVSVYEVTRGGRFEVKVDKRVRIRERRPWNECLSLLLRFRPIVSRRGMPPLPSAQQRTQAYQDERGSYRSSPQAQIQGVHGGKGATRSI